jgi:RimJ/RimL family protein N-acetyltransferase
MSKIRLLEPIPLNNFRLRYVEERDLELLRVWKNINKKSFFSKNEILPEQQKEWFRGFLERPGDYMFMIDLVHKTSQNPIGCIGFRLIDNVIDIYNVIRGEKIDTGFTIGDALHLLLNYIISRFSEKDIICKVLPENPAVSWYERNGFIILEKKCDHFVMIFNKMALRPIIFLTR